MRKFSVLKRYLKEKKTMESLGKYLNSYISRLHILKGYRIDLDRLHLHSPNNITLVKVKDLFKHSFMSHSNSVAYFNVCSEVCLNKINFSSSWTQRHQFVIFLNLLLNRYQTTFNVKGRETFSAPLKIFHFNKYFSKLKEYRWLCLMAIWDS